jgi:hypothetical protein
VEISRKKGKKQPAAITCCGTATRSNSGQASSEMIAQRLYNGLLDLGLDRGDTAFAIVKKYRPKNA